MKVTVTRALAELKTLGNRYEKAVFALNLMAVKQGGKLRSPNNHMKEEDFIEKAKALNNSAVSLYERVIAIKTALDKSNSTTIVEIGGVQMTVQEAIVKKNQLGKRELYLDKLKEISIIAKRDYTQAESENQAAVEKLIAGTISREAPESQKESQRKESEAYIEKTRALSLVDPLGVGDLIEKIEKEISDFEMNVDFVLSESNSTTYIEIPD